MPALPPIILSKPYILVTLTESSIGVISQTSDYYMGIVEAIYDTCDDISVGMKILFSPKTSRALLYGSTIYYVVDESHKLFKEPLPL